MTTKGDAERERSDPPPVDQVEEVHYALSRLRRIYADWRQGADSTGIPPNVRAVLRKLANPKSGARDT
jgi:hypothetical protein